jgi:translation elongation factor EF-1beta
MKHPPEPRLISSIVYGTIGDGAGAAPAGGGLLFVQLNIPALVPAANGYTGDVAIRRVVIPAACSLTKIKIMRSAHGILDESDSTSLRVYVKDANGDDIGAHFTLSDIGTDGLKSRDLSETPVAFAVDSYLTVVVSRENTPGGTEPLNVVIEVGLTFLLD